MTVGYPTTVTISTTGAGGSGGAIGAIGSSGYTYTTNGTGGAGGIGYPYYTSITPPSHTNIKITGKNPILSTEKNDINLDELAEMVKIMRERLLILVPNFEKHEKYEALKKAYDHYKLIEAMIIGDNDESNKR